MQTIYSAALEKTPRTLIVVLFLVWKLLLLTVALLSPGPGYDTSTQLLFKGYGTRSVELANLQPSAHSPTRSWSLSTERLVESLTRWDAIYFASIAERGYVFEQEWAFGWGFTRLLSFLSTSTLFCDFHLQASPHHDINRPNT